MKMEINKSDLPSGFMAPKSKDGSFNFYQYKFSHHGKSVKLSAGDSRRESKTSVTKLRKFKNAIDEIRESF